MSSKAQHKKGQPITLKNREPRQILAEFAIASTIGNEVQAMQQVTQVVRGLHLSQNSLDRLKTAVAEATMNAIEHGNHNRPELPVDIQVLISNTSLAVRVTNQSDGYPIPEPEIPDIEAKLAGLQTPRGWGLFLIKNLMDEFNIIHTDQQHTLELVMFLKDEKVN